LGAKFNTETLARFKQFTNSSNWIIRKPIAIFILLAVTQTVISIVFYGSIYQWIMIAFSIDETSNLIKNKVLRSEVEPIKFTITKGAFI
jgi:hypothetical protein